VGGGGHRGCALEQSFHYNVKGYYYKTRSLFFNLLGLSNHTLYSGSLNKSVAEMSLRVKCHVQALCAK
jgi:hypothetical protein